MEGPVEVLGVQVEPGGHDLGPQETVLLGADEGLKFEWVEAADEETKALNSPCKLDDEDEDEDSAAYRSCCGDGASKV